MGRRKGDRTEAPRTFRSYPFMLASTFTMEMPLGAHVLAVRYVRGGLALMAMVDECPRPSSPTTETFRVFTEGDQVSEQEWPDLVYIDTFSVVDPTIRQPVHHHLFRVEPAAARTDWAVPDPPVSPEPEP